MSNTTIEKLSPAEEAAIERECAGEAAQLATAEKALGTGLRPVPQFSTPAAPSITWPTHLPSPLNAQAGYLSEATRTQAEEANAALETLKQERAAVQQEENNIRTADVLDISPEVLAERARQLNFRIGRVLRDEVPLRERLAGLYADITKDIGAAKQRWDAELSEALNAARAALVAGGFDIEPPQAIHGPGDNYNARCNFESAVNTVLRRHSSVAPLLVKLASLRGAGPLAEQLQNNQDMQKLRLRLEAVRASLLPPLPQAPAQRVDNWPGGSFS